MARWCPYLPPLHWAGHLGALGSGLPHRSSQLPQEALGWGGGPGHPHPVAGAPVGRIVRCRMTERTLESMHVCFLFVRGEKKKESFSPFFFSFLVFCLFVLFFFFFKLWAQVEPSERDTESWTWQVGSRGKDTPPDGTHGVRGGL